LIATPLTLTTTASLAGALMENALLQGTVKWFSQDKGYGFIVGVDGTERYFNVQSVKGVSLPKTGANVEFLPTDGSRGPRAAEVKVLSQPAGHNDERIACRHCGKRIVPRIITNQGVLTRSVCPFCGEIAKDFRPWWPYVLIFAAVVLIFLVTTKFN
jgi:CspA family cold shock protein